jgi:ketosteroid isomerase-like protein
MTRRPAELLRDAYSEPRWSPEAVDRYLQHVDPDVDWRAMEGAADDVGVMHGHEGLRRYLDDWLELFDDLELRIGEIVELDDTEALAALRFSARGKGSGVHTGLDFAIHVQFRNDLIVRGREYATLDEARAAAEAAQTARRS